MTLGVNLTPKSALKISKKFIIKKYGKNYIVTFVNLNYLTFILVQFKTGEEIGSSWCRVLGFVVVLMHCR